MIIRGFFILKMHSHILDFSKQLISIQTDPDKKTELDSALDLTLSHLSEFTIEHFEKNGVRSALVYNTPTRPDKFKLLLNCHLDVIPGKKEQYSPRIEGDKLLGVGAMDMKANLACAVFAFKEIASKTTTPIALQLVTDEEIGGFDGTKHQVEQGVNADFILATEPTNFDIVHTAKGVLWLHITAKGETAHGAYPWRGDNAIWKMHSFLNELKKHYKNPKKQEWVTTLNLSSITSSNQTYNKIPDDCAIGIDIRFIAEDKDTILKDVTSLIPHEFSVEILANEPATFVEKNNPFVEKLAEITARHTSDNVVLRGAQGSSDARHFEHVGSSGIEFGPIGDGIGSDDEWVSISSLETYYEILKEYLLSV